MSLSAYKWPLQVFEYQGISEYDTVTVANILNIELKFISGYVRHPLGKLRSATMLSIFGNN